MASVLFNLKRNKGKLAHIRMIYWYCSQYSITYYTGEKIPEKDFSTKSLVRRSHPSAGSVNQFLNHLKLKAEEVKREMMIEATIYTPAEFKEKLDIKLGKVKTTINLHEYCDTDYDEKLRLSGNDPHKVRTYKSNYKLIKQLVDDTPLNKVDVKTYKALRDSLLDQNKAPSYVRKVTSTFKALLRRAMRDQLIPHIDFTTLDKIKNVKPKDQIYCELEELEKMYYHKYDSERLRNAANIFIIGAFTSMRVSEYMKVVRDPHQHIHKVDLEDGTSVRLIKILSSDKTNKKVAIPMHYIISDMLKSYDIHPISDQKLNDYLKEIGEEIGMTQDFTRIEYKGRKEEKVTYKRFQLLSSHTARRSFVTILYMMGVDIKVIMQFTTHSTERQLLEYVKLDAEMNAIRMAKHDFFTKRPSLKVLK